MNNLNFLREEPPLNWLDFFVDRKKFCLFLETEGPDSKQVSTLANQFVEQAISVDKELELSLRKEVDEEELMHKRRKSTKLWIYALSCFASIDWNLDLIKQCCNIISIKALMNHLVYFCYPSKTVNMNNDALPVLVEFQRETDGKFDKPEQLFACWLYASWLLKVDVEGRFPDVVAKPTVSNPFNQFDANLMQGEQFRNCIAELRRSAGDAEYILKKILEKNCNFRMVVPTSLCFLEALSKAPVLFLLPLVSESLAENQNLYLLLMCTVFYGLTNNLHFVSCYDDDRNLKESISSTDSILNSRDMNAPMVPVLSFQSSNVQVDHNWTLKVLYSLMCYHFAAGKLEETKSELTEIIKNWPKYKKGWRNSVVVISNIDENDLGGYCDALGITHSFRRTVPRDPSEELIYGPISEKTLEILDRCSMVHRSECLRIACTSASTLADNILVENTVLAYVNGFPAPLATLTKLAAKSIAVSHLIKVCSHSLMKRTNEQAVKEVIQYLATKIPNFVEGIVKECPSYTKNHFGTSKDIPRRPVCAIPDISHIRELLSGCTDGWRMIVSFDMNEIKGLYAKMGGKVSVPRRSRISRMIGDVISPAASQGNFDYINLLLGKLEQLAAIGDGAQWTSFCNECVKEMGPLGKVQEIQVRFAFDAVRVQLECWHNRFSRVSNNPQFVHVTQTLNSTVKGLIQSSVTSPVTMSKMMLHTVTFFINTSEWEFILRSFMKLKSPFLDVARMIAAYMTSSEPSVARQIAEGPWWHVMSITFLDHSLNNKRRSDGSLVREQTTKQLLTKKQFLEFLRLIKEYRTLSFLISFLGKMFNVTQNMLKARKEADGLVAGHDIDKDIFVEHSDYWLSCYENKGSNDELFFNLSFLTECLETAFKNALIVNPINAFWLRSFADFCHACDKFHDALVLYMEACVACSESLLRPLPDNVVDDIMWLKVQRCLRMTGAETLAALICQMMRNPTDRYVPTATALLETHGDTLDACPALFPLITDINLGEFMSDVYEKLHLQKREQLLVRAFSVPEMNSHNINQLERFRRRERLLLVLCSQIFQINI